MLRRCCLGEHASGVRQNLAGTLQVVLSVDGTMPFKVAVVTVTAHAQPHRLVQKFLWQMTRGGESLTYGCGGLLCLAGRILTCIRQRPYCVFCNAGRLCDRLFRESPAFQQRRHSRFPLRGFQQGTRFRKTLFS